MESVRQTLEQITEGLTVQSEYDILPIYQDGELLNGAAYAAYRFKRLMNAAREHAGHIAVQTANAASTVVSHMTADYPEW
jgi:hypothetical protein